MQGRMVRGYPKHRLRVPELTRLPNNLPLDDPQLYAMHGEQRLKHLALDPCTMLLSAAKL